MTKVVLEAGDTLFNENDTAEHMYYVVNGEIELFTAVNGEMLVLDHIGRGDMFGELALINGDPRTANAIATRQTVLASLTKQELLLKVKNDATFAAKMICKLAKKLKGANKALKDQLGHKTSMEITFGGKRDRAPEEECLAAEVGASP